MKAAVLAVACAAVVAARCLGQDADDCCHNTKVADLCGLETDLAFVKVLAGGNDHHATSQRAHPSRETSARDLGIHRSRADLFHPVALLADVAMRAEALALTMQTDSVLSALDAKCCYHQRMARTALAGRTADNQLLEYGARLTQSGRNIHWETAQIGGCDCGRRIPPEKNKRKRLMILFPSCMTPSANTNPRDYLDLRILVLPLL